MAMKRTTFTLVEVIMALIIIVIAIVAITGVFPLSMRMHHNAMHQNQATDVAEEIMNYASYRVLSNSTRFTTSRTGVINHLETADVDINNSSDWKVENWNQVNTKYYYYDDAGGDTSGVFDDGIIRVIRTHNAYRGDDVVSVTELDVVIAIWESSNSPTPYFYNYDSMSDTLQFSKGSLEDANNKDSTDIDVVRLNVEASWPGSAPYADRKKIVMVTEVRIRP